MKQKFKEIEELGTYYGIHNLKNEESKSWKEIIFYPGSKFISIWNYVMYVLCVYSAFALPMEYCYFLHFVLKKQGIYAYHYFDFLTSIIFFIDSLLQFRVAVILPTGNLLLDKTELAKRYVKSKFIINFLMSIPLNGFIESDDNYVLRSMLILPKFFRIYKLLNIRLGVMESYYFKIISFFSLYYLIAHYFGCFLFIFNRDTKKDIVKTLSDQISNIYLNNTLTAILLLAGNNMQPNSTKSRFFYVFVIFVGTLVESLLFGTMALLFTKFNPIDKIRSRRMYEINSACFSLNLNESITKEIRLYYENLWYKNRSKFINSRLFKEMNICLKTRYMILIAKDNFSSNIIFSKFSVQFITSLFKSLDTVLFQYNEIVIFEGMKDKKLYFGSNDSKFLVKTNGSIIRYLIGSEMFGEICFFLKSGLRTSSVVSCTSSVSFELDEKAIHRLMYDYPFEAIEVMRVATERFYSSIDLMDYNFLRKINSQQNEATSIWNEDILTLINKLNNQVNDKQQNSKSSDSNSVKKNNFCWDKELSKTVDDKYKRNTVVERIADRKKSVFKK